jgi:hypothetical protein
VPVERVLVPPGGGSDHEPAIWRGELVFLRRSGPPRARRPDELLAWTIGSGAPHTLALPRSRGNRAASWPAGLTGTLTALSFDGREVAYVTSNRVGTRGESTLWFQALGRRPLLIDQVTGGAGDTCAPAFLSPVLTGPWLYAYLHACDPSADPRLDRLTRYRHGRVQRAAHRFLRAGDEEISAAVPDGAGVAWSSEGGVQQLASVTWRAIAPPVAQSFCGRTDPFC